MVSVPCGSTTRSSRRRTRFPSWIGRLDSSLTGFRIVSHYRWAHWVTLCTTHAEHAEHSFSVALVCRRSCHWPVRAHSPDPRQPPLRRFEQPPTPVRDVRGSPAPSRRALSLSLEADRPLEP